MIVCIIKTYAHSAIIVTNNNLRREGGKSILYLFCLDQPDEMLKGAVIGGFSIFWKTTGRKLPTFQVIADAVAANALAGARVITTVAMGEILFFFAFHGGLLVVIQFYSLQQTSFLVGKIFLSVIVIMMLYFLRKL